MLSNETWKKKTEKWRRFYTEKIFEVLKAINYKKQESVQVDYIFSLSENDSGLLCVEYWQFFVPVYSTK